MIKLGSDKREAQRYTIAGAVSWQGGDGLTENVSTSGIYFVTRRRLQVGQSVQLTVTLPRQLISVIAKGAVVRVEPRGAGFGVGVRLVELWPLLAAGNREVA